MYTPEPTFRKLLVLFLFIFTGIGVQAQSPVFAPVDSLLKAGNPAGAADKCREICDKLKSVENPDHAVLLEGLDKLGKMLLDQARPADAAAAFGEAAQIAKAKSGPASADYGKFLNNQAIALQQANRYKEALALSLMALDIAEKTVGAAHRTYGIRANTVGSTYYGLRDYEQAGRYYKIAMDQALATGGPENPAYLSRKSNHAACLFFSGHLDSALYNQRELLDYFEKKGDTTGAAYISLLNNIGYSYIWIQQPEDALTYLLHADRISNRYGSSEQQLLIWRNIGSAKVDLGSVDEGIRYFNTAMEWARKNLPAGHTAYLDLLAELVVVYRQLNDRSNLQATALLLEEALQSMAADNTPYLYSALATAHSHLGNNDRAVIFARKAVDGYYQMGATPHLYYPAVSVWATLAIAQQKYDDAKQLLWEAADWIGQHINDVYSVMTESQRSQYHRYLEPFSALCTAAKNGHIEFNSRLFEETTLLKSLSLLDYREMLNHFRSNQSDTAAYAAFQAWFDLRQQLARLSTMPPDLHYLPVDSLRERAVQLELQFTNSFTPFRQARQKVAWTDLQKALQPGEAIVDFYGYIPVPGKDSLVYYAMVLRPGDTAPQWVELCDEQQLMRLLNGGVAPSGTNSSRGLRPRAATASAALYQLVWQPLDNLLEGVKKIYYSPSGWLYRVAFTAIPTPEGKVLGSRYAMECLINPRILATSPAQAFNAAKTEAVLFGGVDYDGQSKEKATPLPIGSFRIAPVDIQPWPYLPGSEKEVKNLAALLERNNVATRVLTGAAATEEAFAQLGKGPASPAIIHLASHGFSFPRNNNRLINTTTELQNPFTASANPLLRSGIVLAGANETWLGHNIAPDRQDGVLTSLEISNSNLSNTQLVVLSACESGLGDMNNQEGVFGLSRAFKQAGANYLLVNLWPVPDKEAAVFMENFYRNWLKGSTLEQAFHKTQRFMRKRYTPDVWGGWVLMR